VAKYELTRTLTLTLTLTLALTLSRGESVAKYVGQWLANEMHGRGTLSYPDGR
jgi:hypothetical protein|tara:strand:+ start:251 stop:409 length:159 start_codon:yes stop_codon:yes gene_type:complete